MDSDGLGAAGTDAGVSAGSGLIHSGISDSGAKGVNGFSFCVSRAGVLSLFIHSGTISTGFEGAAGVSCSQSGTFSKGDTADAGGSAVVAPLIQSGIASMAEPEAAGGFIHSGSEGISVLGGFGELNQSGMLPGSTSNGPVFVSGFVHSGRDEGGSASTDGGGGAESQSGIPDTC